MFKVMDKYRMPAQILLGAVGISFVWFGLAGFQTGSNNNYILRIGDQIITRNQLEDAVRNTEEAGGTANREAVFQTLVSRAYLTEGARQMGVVVSDEQIKQMIVDNPQFHNADNKFDPSLFQTFLNNIRRTEQQFIEEQRNNLLTVGLLAALNGGAVSDFQAAGVLNATLTPRKVRMISINPAPFADKVKVDEAAVKKFYEANKKSYELPQAVKFEYVRLSPKDLTDKQTVSPEELKQAAAQTGTQSKRRLAHILINAPETASAEDKAKAKAEAEKIAKQAKAEPAKFAELAKKHSQDDGSAANGGDLGEFARNGALEKSLEDTAFNLKKGEVSSVVQSQHGFHILYVSEAAETGGTAQAEQAVKEKKAQQAYAKLREELGELAFATPDSLKAAADKLGLTVQNQSEWLTRSNAESLGVPKAVSDVLFGDEVFKFNKKHNSEPVSVNGETWVVRPLEIRMQSIEPFEKVAERVREDYVRSEALRLAREEAKKTVAALQAGKKTEDLSWSGVQQVIPAQARSVLPPENYRAFMQAVPKNGKPAYAFLEGIGMPEIWEVQTTEAVDNPQALQMARQYLAQGQGNALIEAYINSLRSSIKTQQGAERVSESE